jgi:hypothetical protein
LVSKNHGKAKNPQNGIILTQKVIDNNCPKDYNNNADFPQ